MKRVLFKTLFLLLVVQTETFYEDLNDCVFEQFADMPCRNQSQGGEYKCTCNTAETPPGTLYLSLIHI